MFLPSPIMMVCTGNLCRSPFAEHYMRKRLEEKGIQAECFSRGLLPMPGRKAPELAVKVAADFGVDLGGHLSHPIQIADVDRAALVMVMEPEQRQYLGKMRPAHIGKVFLLSQPHGGGAVEDPMGRDEACFHRVYQEIVALVDAWLVRFGIA